MRLLLYCICILFFLVGCSKDKKEKWGGGIQSQIIVDMIEAVNEKNAENYVKEFDKNVKVYKESDMKINGRNGLKENRASHFRSNPNVRSEIQYLIEIDNKVVLHDKVWLDDSPNV